VRIIVIIFFVSMIYLKEIIERSMAYRFAC